MIINSIIQVNIGYIPGYNSRGLGGVAHEQVAPMAQTMRRK